MANKMKKIYTIESYDIGCDFANEVEEFTNLKKAKSEAWALVLATKKDKKDTFHSNASADAVCVDYIQIIATCIEDENYYEVVKKYEV